MYLSLHHVWSLSCCVLDAAFQEMVVYTLTGRWCQPYVTHRKLELGEVKIIYTSLAFRTVLLMAFRNPCIYTSAMACLGLFILCPLSLVAADVGPDTAVGMCSHKAP